MGKINEFNKQKHMYYDQNILPDGKRFVYWEREKHYIKTWFVDQKAPNACDDGPGTDEIPFRTIAKAASIVKPGERVFIRKGKYFETIRDVSGGIDADNMVLFEGEDGAVITGAIIWKPDFVPSQEYRQTPIDKEWDLFHTDHKNWYSNSGASVWMGDLPSDGSLYENGYNPFLIMNLHSMAWIPLRNSYPKALNPSLIGSLDRDEHLMKRGLVFVNGRRLKQVIRYFELYEQEDVFWVDETYKRLHVHLKDNEDPGNCTFEITIHEQGFMPKTSGLGYICFKNLSFEKFANPIKVPQIGALSSNCGHHFIIENCRFSDINSVAVDVGFIGHNHMHEGIRGYHIVRGNLFERCGVSALAAPPTMGYYMENMLVENNTLIDNGFHNFEMLYESSALKSHFTKDSMYRNNFICGMKGCGIWLDNHNYNTRVTGNIILDIHNCTHGALFNEATLNPVMFDHNFIANVSCYQSGELKDFGGYGIYEHHCEKTIVWENICINTQKDAIHFCYSDPKMNVRYLCDNRRSAMMKDNIAIGNLICGCSTGVALSTERDACDANYIQDAAMTECTINADGSHHNRESFRECYGFEQTESSVVSMQYQEEKLTIQLCNGKICEFIPQPGASVMELFQNMYE